MVRRTMSESDGGSDDQHSEMVRTGRTVQEIPWCMVGHGRMKDNLNHE